jgi:hypothetical protein
VFERFGFSPRAGIPSLDVQTFASRPHRSDRAYDTFESVYPIDGGDWIDHDDGERVATGPRSLLLRGQPRPVPTAADYAAAGVELTDPERPHVFELCRCVAAMHRDEVLATEAERRVHVPPACEQLLVLDDWHHPNLIVGDQAERVADVPAARRGAAHRRRRALPPDRARQHALAPLARRRVAVTRRAADARALAGEVRRTSGAVATRRSPSSAPGSASRRATADRGAGVAAARSPLSPAWYACPST